MTLCLARLRKSFIACCNAIILLVALKTYTMLLMTLHTVCHMWTIGVHVPTTAPCVTAITLCQNRKKVLQGKNILG